MLNKIRASEKIKLEVMKSTFVPAFFALYGMSLLSKPNYYFQPFINQQLLVKAKEYYNIGPAIEYLCKKIRDFNAGKWPVQFI